MTLPLHPPRRRDVVPRVGLLCLALGGCAQTPELPALATLTAFTPPPQFLQGPASASAPAVSASSAPPWWQAQGDPLLDRLMALALAHNADLGAAKARIDEARAAAGLDEAARRLQLSAGPSVGRSRSSEHLDPAWQIHSTTGGAAPPVTVETEPASTRLRLGLDASYEVDLWGRLNDTARASAHEAQATVLDLEAARRALTLSVASTYEALRVHQGQLLLRDELAQLALQRWHLAQASAQAGLGDAGEADALEAALRDAQLQASQIRQQYAQDFHALSVLCGVAVDQLPAVNDTQGTPVPLPPLSDVPSRVLQRRPDVQAAELRLQAALDRLGAARAANFPSLLLTTSLGRESSALSTLLDPGSLVWSLGLQISQSVLDGGRRTAQADAAQARLDEAAQAYQGTLLQALREVEDALVAEQAVQDQLRQQQAAAEAAHRQALRQLQRVDVGLGRRTDALAAQQTALQRELTLLDLRQQLFLAQATLRKVMAWPA